MEYDPKILRQNPPAHWLRNKQPGMGIFVFIQNLRHNPSEQTGGA